MRRTARYRSSLVRPPCWPPTSTPTGSRHCVSTSRSVAMRCPSRCATRSATPSTSGPPMTGCASSSSPPRAARSARASTSRSSPKPELARTIRDSSHRYHLAVWQFPKPVIAAVNGAAFGGGFDLCLLCDMRIATPNAVFAHPEIKFGAPPLFTPLQWIVGAGIARELCLTGRRVDAAEAHRIGLVNAIVDADRLEGGSDGDRSGDGRGAAARTRSHQALSGFQRGRARSTTRSRSNTIASSTSFCSAISSPPDSVAACFPLDGDPATLRSLAHDLLGYPSI